MLQRYVRLQVYFALAWAVAEHIAFILVVVSAFIHGPTDGPLWRVHIIFVNQRGHCVIPTFILDSRHGSIASCLEPFREQSARRQPHDTIH